MAPRRTLAEANGNTPSTNGDAPDGGAVKINGTSDGTSNGVTAVPAPKKISALRPNKWGGAEICPRCNKSVSERILENYYSTQKVSIKKTKFVSTRYSSPSLCAVLARPGTRPASPAWSARRGWTRPCSASARGRFTAKVNPFRIFVDLF